MTRYIKSLHTHRVDRRARETVVDRAYHPSFRKPKDCTPSDGMDARCKRGDSAAFACELCQITGMTLAELREHWRATHRD